MREFIKPYAVAPSKLVAREYVTTSKYTDAGGFGEKKIECTKMVLYDTPCLFIYK